MYAYSHDSETGGLLLTDTPSSFSKEPRPVYSRELDILGFGEYWKYEQRDDVPYLWAESNFYWYRGQRVAKTSGGSLYEKPSIELEKDENGVERLPAGSVLIPVDIPRMVEKNRVLLEVLELRTIKKIFDVYRRYKSKLDCFHVAFSGGKDSIVLLELVKSALPPNAFLVVFGDTGMEFPDTYRVVETVEAECKAEGIAFYRATSHLKPEESWKLFGPPSRVLRWCCSVHKSVPQTLKIREVLGKMDYRGMAFVGVRAHESAKRDEQLTKKDVKLQSQDEQSYVDTFGKVKGQLSTKSIYEWTSAEVWLYSFYRDLIINEAYKKGSSRVGCICCPLESVRADFVQKFNYNAEATVFLNIIEESNGREDVSNHDYLINGGWNARKNGRFLKGNNPIYSEQYLEGFLCIDVLHPKTDWKEWVKTIGNLTRINDNDYTLIYKNRVVTFCVITSANGFLVKIPEAILREEIELSKLFRIIFRKAAYCVKCGTCSSNCRNGCISFVGGFKIENCQRCHKCGELNNGCLVYDSLKIPLGEGKNMDDVINCYSNHAPMTVWISAFFEKDDYIDGLGGNPQRTKFKKFLKDAGLLFNNERSFFSQKIKDLGWKEESSLGLMLVNLAHTPQFRWYIRNLNCGQVYTRKDVEDMLSLAGQSGGNTSSVINAFKRICDLPFGTRLKFGKTTKKGSVLETLSRTKTTLQDSRVVLYSLYKFAEACDGYYEFTLSRLMDFTVESSGVSPAEIFGFSRDELEQILHGLARTNPDFLSFTTTHDLEIVRLSDDKTSENVLETF